MVISEALTIAFSFIPFSISDFSLSLKRNKLTQLQLCESLFMILEILTLKITVFIKKLTTLFSSNSPIQSFWRLARLSLMITIRIEKRQFLCMKINLCSLKLPA